MKIKHSIYKLGKSGGRSVKKYNNPWVLRFRWRDETGTKRVTNYYFRTELSAKDARPKLEADLITSQGRNVIGNQMTFADLAEEAKRTFYAPAEYSQGRKITGIKSHRQTWILIDSLVQHFGGKPLSSMSRTDMDSYKSWRIKQGDLRGAQGKLKPKDRKSVALSTVNRALAIFRRMMKYAYAEGWISRDITIGSKAIDNGAEKARTRTLTAEEETLLLASCTGERMITYTRGKKTISLVSSVDNPHLKAIILFALDAGLRRNEVLTLDWSDLDFKNRSVTVRSQHTKTQESRRVPMTSRLIEELRSLPGFSKKGAIFPFNDFKRSLKTAMKIAGIEGLTFHDLRRTYITRLNVSGVPLAIAGKLAGHKTLSTTQKHYVSIEDPAILEDVRRKMDEQIERKNSEELIN